MGKTKTVVLTGAPEEKSGKDSYEEKRKKREEQEKKEKEKIRVPGLGGGQRVTSVSEGPIIEEVKEEKVLKKPRVRSKNYKSAKTKIDKSKTYKLQEAIKLIKETSYAKFDPTLEMHIVVTKDRLQQAVELPHSSGKQKRVEIADEKTIEKLKKGKLDFDILLATPDMMSKLVPFAKILGPKGLMPNPKNQTLIKSKKDAEKFAGNSIVVKTEKKQPIIHTITGKMSMDEKKLAQNVEAVISAIGKKDIAKAYLTSTMSPSVRLDLS